MKFDIVGTEVLLEVFGAFVVEDLVGDVVVSECKELVHLCLCSYELSCCLVFDWLYQDGICFRMKKYHDVLFPLDDVTGNRPG